MTGRSTISHDISSLQHVPHSVTIAGVPAQNQTGDLQNINQNYLQHETTCLVVSLGGAGKPEISVMITCLRTHIWTRDLTNAMKNENYRFIPIRYSIVIVFKPYLGLVMDICLRYLSAQGCLYVAWPVIPRAVAWEPQMVSVNPNRFALHHIHTVLSHIKWDWNGDRREHQAACQF
jgi:hypothetical protein